MRDQLSRDVPIEGNHRVHIIEEAMKCLSFARILQDFQQI